MPKPPKGMFRKGRSWYHRIRTGGKDDWCCLGPDFSEACRKYRGIRGGEVPPARVTVADAAKQWTETYVQVHREPKSAKLACRRVELYLKPALGFMILGRVKPDDLRAYRLWLERQGISLQTVSHILSDCRCFFLWCLDSGLIDRSPVPRRLLPKIQERPPDRLSDEEVKLLLAKLEGSLDWTVRFGLGTGMRWGEMTRAQVADVDFRQGVIVVHGTKSGRLRRVPLPPDLLAALRGRVGKVVPYSPGSASSITRDVRSVSGVGRFHLHQLRHTFACRFIENGGGLAALQQILGHTSVVTTQRYARLTDEVVFREAAKVFAVENGRRNGRSRSLSPYALVAQVDRAAVS